jgi:hypothetical protein
VNEGKSLMRNLLLYGMMLFPMIGVFSLLSTGPNPGLILPGITLSIFFIYHSIFFKRKSRSDRSNHRLFAITTLVPAIAIMVFLAVELGLQELSGTLAWVILVIAVAVPIYFLAIKKILAIDSSLLTFFVFALRFTAMISIVWVPVVLTLNFFRPDVQILFFLDDLLALSVVTFLLSGLLKKIPDIRIYLKNHL